MDEMIELLKQIQELAGVGIDALKGAKGGGPQEKGGGENPAPKPPAEEEQQSQMPPRG